MRFACTLEGKSWVFPDLRELLARASPHRSGDVLAGAFLAKLALGYDIRASLREAVDLATDKVEKWGVGYLAS